MGSARRLPKRRFKRQHEANPPGMIVVKSHFPGQKSRDWLIAAIAVALSIGMSSPGAWAGCSHLVTTKADTLSLKIGQFDGLPSRGIFQGDLSNPLLPGKPPFAPCHGFLCSGNSIPLPPLATPASLLRIDAWSRIDLCSLARSFWSTRLSRDETSPRSVDRVEQLARPPR
jgi:hypothetical protein